MSNNRYEDPILHELKSLLDRKGPKELRGRWSVGDSINVPVSSLPRGFISYDGMVVKDDTDFTVVIENRVIISVAVDMKKEVIKPVERAGSHEQIIEIMAGRDPETCKYLEDSIAGCLIKNEDLDLRRGLHINVGNEEMEMDFGMGIEKRGPGVMTAEGVLKFTVRHEQNRG